MNKIFATSSVAAAMLFSVSVYAAQETYAIDSEHSFANWSLRHVVAKTSGTFNDVQGKVVIDRSNLANSSVEARINMLSVSSNHAKRDAHIVKEDYLNASKFGEMTFVSTKVVARNETGGEITGKLTLHGVTKEITFPFKVLGFGDDPWGGHRVGLEGHTTIKASDFGYKWGLKPGGPVGDDIEITLLIEGKRQ
ncbi:MAG: polyisoprenoid-binding protein [Betaproteobacteria bacterium HGW-Betaproteobacteria-8]|nr:MAG: polyisoprenoid-binding protein [Betaproteobacteria bacterium HGW-Betaproteobacteria-8]